MGREKEMTERLFWDYNEGFLFPSNLLADYLQIY